MNYDNTNRGSIWKNERKTTDTHPDFTGSINVEGVEYFLDAWKRKPDANPKAPPLSFKVKRKDKQDTQSGNDRSQNSDVRSASENGFRKPEPDFVDDDLPF